MPALPSSISQLAFTLIALAILIAALILGAHLLVPLALGALLAFILSPMLDWLVRKGVPHGLAIAMLMMGVLGSAVAASTVLTTQIASAVTTVSDNQANLLIKLTSLMRSGASDSSVAKAKASLDRLQGRIAHELQGSAAGMTSVEPKASLPTTGTAASKESFLGAASALLEPLAIAGLTLLFVGFLLAGRDDVRDRLVRIAGTDNVSATTAALSAVGSSLSQLFLAQLIVNAGFGAFVAIALWAIGLPNPILWGVAAAALRFVPFVGAFIAAIPPLLLAASIEPGWTTLLLTLAVFVVIEPIVGHVIEPLVVGKAVGVSPIAMLISAGFWTMIWGPIGLLMAAPLTTCLVVLGRHVPALNLFDIAFSDTPPLPDDVRLYHRLIAAEGHLLESAVSASETERAAWIDTKLIPALRLAAVDYKLGRLGGAQSERLAENIEALVDDLPHTSPSNGAPQLRPSPEAQIAVIAARGPIDEALASIVSAHHKMQGAWAVKSGSGLTALQSVALGDANPIAVVIVTAGGADESQLAALTRRAKQLLPSIPLRVLNASLETSSAYRDRTNADTRLDRAIVVTTVSAIAPGLSLAARDEVVPIERALAKLEASE